jgi:hypothetical protein
MTEAIHISSAGNTQAPALAILRELSYSVTRIPSASGEDSLLQASRGSSTLVAEDPLSLLGLAAIEKHRGLNWQPTDAEVISLLSLLGHANV